MEDVEFVRNVKEDLEEFKTSVGRNKGDQFVVWFLTKILQEDEGTAIERYHIGGPADNKLDIGICDEDHEIVIIGQCKYSENPDTKTFNVDLPEEAKNAYDRLLELPEEGNEKRKEFAKALSESKKPRKIIAVGFGVVNKDAYKYANKHNIEIFDFDKIKRRYIYNEVYLGLEKPGFIDFEIPEGKYIEEKIPDENIRQWVFLLPINEIYGIMDRYGDGIFELNLRYKLEQSAKRGINKEIFDTVVKKDKAFSALNNGVTIVTSGGVPSEEKLRLFTPQIINGCQTCWAIYDAIGQLKKAGENTENIKDIKVLVKAVETKEDEFIKKIRLSTNKQNPIGWKDIRSEDPIQASINLAFKEYKLPIFYDFRDGLWGTIVRKNDQGRYRISGKRYRKIANEKLGQIYLALLGKPFFSKQRAKDILKEDEFYRVIFKYDLDVSTRFTSSELELEAKRVFPESGLENLVKDTLFGFAVFQLAEGIKQIYRKKINNFVIQDPENVPFKMLKDERKFLTHWHYLLIASVNYIVFKWSKRGEDREILRRKLIGDDYDLFFGPSLQGEFKINEDPETASVIDEDNPSKKFPLFSIWVQKLTEQLSNMVREHIGKTEYTSSRWFIDQRPDTYYELCKWVDEQYATSKSHWARTFPVEIE